MAFPPAAWLDSFGLDLRQALQSAARLGFHAVHANAAARELDPREFSQSARRHLRRFLGDLGLELGALALDYPGRGLADPEHAGERLETFRNMLPLCRDLGIRRAGVSLSGFDDDHAAPLACELLTEVAEQADRWGIDTAVCDPAAGPEASAPQVRVLACPHLHIAVDTARLVPGNPDAIADLDLVRAVYLRDVRRQAERVEEVAYGQGEVDFAALLARLEVVAQQAALVLRRDTPGGVDALGQGREYMESLMGRSSSH